MKSLASKYCTYRCPSNLKYRNSLAHPREEVYRWGFQRKQLLFNKCQFFLIQPFCVCVFSVFNFISVQTRDKLVKIERSMKETEWSVSKIQFDQNKTKTVVVFLQFVRCVPNSGAVCCKTSKYLLIGIKKQKMYIKKK